MKKYLSILSIAVRSSIYKIMIILLGMGALQIGLFVRTLKERNVAENVLRPDMITTTNIQSLEQLMEGGHIDVIFRLAFLAVCFVLTWAVGEKKGVKTESFYNRLSVGIAGRYAMWSVYSFVCIWLLIIVQVGLVYIMGQLYLNTSQPDFISPQMYFLAFYRSDFLHNILPMDNISRWIQNILLFVALSTEIARYGCTNKRSTSVTFIAIMIVLSLRRGMSFMAGDIIEAFAAVVVIGVNIILIIEKDQGKQREEVSNAC